MEKQLVDKINEQTKAINTLSNRIDNKMGREQLEELFAKMEIKIEEYKYFVSQFTQGLADFFSETMVKNTEANDKLEETVRINNVMIDNMKEWFTAMLTEAVAKYKETNEEKIEWL